MNHQAAAKPGGMHSAKRVRRDPADVKTPILQTAGDIILAEGYAAVTIIEDGVGMSLGHAQARLFVEQMLKQLPITQAETA